MALKNQCERLYYNYASSLPFEAGILEQKPLKDGKTAVLLDKTIFFPEGGGQPADRGTINGVPLLDVIEKDAEILHLVSDSDAEKLKKGPGSRAELILDVRRRRDLACLHTGQHLLSATLLHIINAPTVSMHMGDEYCTIDVDIAEINEKTLLEAEEIVADAIEENHPVIVHLCPPEDLSSFPLRKLPPQGEEVLRIVEIEGHDIIACCGTHLKSTAEIGLFRILGTERYKGMNRITFLAGRRLLNDCRLLRKNAVIVSRAISVPVNEIGKGVLDHLEKTAQIEKHLKDLEMKAVQGKAEALIRKAAEALKAAEELKVAGAARTAEAANVAAAAEKDSAGPAPVMIIESFAEEEISELLHIGKLVQKQSSSAVFILVSERDSKFAAFCQTEGFDIKGFLKDSFEANGGRGGGSSSFFQGSFTTKEALNKFLKTIKESYGFIS